MTTGTRIKELRLAHGYRQTDLAKLVGCSSQVISNIERGVTVVSADLALKIANEFHVQVEEIMIDSTPTTVYLTEDESLLLSNYRKLLSSDQKLLLIMSNRLLEL